MYGCEIIHNIGLKKAVELIWVRHTAFYFSSVEKA
jgi:hypothetical protein